MICSHGPPPNGDFGISGSQTEGGNCVVNAMPAVLESRTKGDVLPCNLQNKKTPKASLIVVVIIYVQGF